MMSKDKGNRILKGERKMVNEMRITTLISKLENMGYRREDIISEIDITLDSLNIERKALSQETITDELANDIIYGFIAESEMN